MVLVHAFKMTETQFFYYCPFCPKIHFHGNCRDFMSNRTEGRSSHCLNRNKNPSHREVEVVISNKTRRFLYSRLFKNLNFRFFFALKYPIVFKFLK